MIVQHYGHKGRDLEVSIIMDATDQRNAVAEKHFGAPAEMGESKRLWYTGPEALFPVFVADLRETEGREPAVSE